MSANGCTHPHNISLLYLHFCAIDTFELAHGLFIYKLCLHITLYKFHWTNKTILKTICCKVRPKYLNKVTLQTPDILLWWDFHPKDNHLQPNMLFISKINKIITNFNNYIWKKLNNKCLYHKFFVFLYFLII